MQYALLLYGDEKVWHDAAEEERAAMYEKHERFLQLLLERDAVRGGAELAASTTATTIRRDGDEVTMTDGPFAETVEQLAGFYVIEAADLDEALELARHLPSANVEVRPLVERPEAGT